MFDRILIANRGEIACRVIRTCRRLGVGTVAVYSDADRDALHVALADRAVPIGGPAPAESYLRGDRIIAAALATGAQAIHPGYGFLSENPDFVDAVAAAGLIFIGPSAPAIRAMGLKDAAKRLMARRGRAGRAGLPRRRSGPGRLEVEAAAVRLSGADQGGGGRRRQGHAPRGSSAGLRSMALESAQAEARGGLRQRRGADREIRRERRAISRCRCSATARGRCISSSATARSSAGTRR